MVLSFRQMVDYCMYLRIILQLIHVHYINLILLQTMQLTIDAANKLLLKPHHGLQVLYKQDRLKIYMAMWKDTAVSVIENPDVYGTGCNFSLIKFHLAAGEPVQFGFPTLIQI